MKSFIAIFCLSLLCIPTTARAGCHAVAVQAVVATPVVSYQAFAVAVQPVVATVVQPQVVTQTVVATPVVAAQVVVQKQVFVPTVFAAVAVQKQVHVVGQRVFRQRVVQRRGFFGRTVIRSRVIRVR